MRRTVLSVVFLSFLILPAWSAFAQTGGGQQGTQGAQDPATVVTAMLNAGKSKNYDLAMTYFADNATIVNNAGPSFGEQAETYTNLNDIRKKFVETVPADLQILSVQTSGDMVTAVVRSVEVLEPGPGGGPPPSLTHIDFQVTATVVNGKIQTATLDLTPQSKAEVKAAIAQFQGPGGPGMPRTGNADQLALLLGLALLGLVLAVVGVVMVRARV